MAFYLLHNYMDFIKSLEKILKDIKEKASEYEKIKNNFILKSENSITNFEKTNVNLIE